MDPIGYKIWTSDLNSPEEFVVLDDFINKLEVRNKLLLALSSNKGAWIRVGIVEQKDKVLEWDDLEERMLRYIKKSKVTLAFYFLLSYLTTSV